MNTLESCIPWLNASCDPAIFSDSNFCQLNPSVRRQRRWRWWCRWCRDGRRRFRAGFAVCGNGCLLVFVTQTHAHTHKHSVSQSAKHTYTHTLQLQRLLMLLLRCAALMMMWRWWWLSLSICLDSHFGDNIYLGFTKNQSQWICGRLFQPFCCRRRGLVALLCLLCGACVSHAMCFQSFGPLLWLWLTHYLWHSDGTFIAYIYIFRYTYSQTPMPSSNEKNARNY